MTMMSLMGRNLVKQLRIYFFQLYFRLTKRVENIEAISGSIKKKIDIVLSRLEDMEEDTEKKKDHMSKLMDEFVEGF